MPIQVPIKNDCIVRVNAGTCGMITRIKATADDMGFIILDVESDCHHILKMSWVLEPIMPY